MNFGTKPYGLEGQIENDGNGNNMYRGETFGQPRTLKPGDVLANGLKIAEEHTQEANGGVGLYFTDGTNRIIAARVPLLLEGGTSGKYPIDLEVGDIFESGSVVLAPTVALNVDDPRYVANRSEVKVVITGGFSGHPIEMPSDLIVALHSEAYPPTRETKFGAYVIDNVLKMGAKARQNLPAYGRLDGQPESDRVASVFEEISDLRTTAKSEKAVLEHTYELLKEQCEQLRGVELLITGRLFARGGTTVAKDNPESWVENILVEITSAKLSTNERYGNLITQHQPFIEFYGRSVENDEMVGAWIGVEQFGVSVKYPTTEG
ncbi:MAG: hypothetical protein JWO54_79 [Candidatus Saccharibacteria bacterium]|nr:hypothetical protein [Candidatus Saccharibacteria bacterium]